MDIVTTGSAPLAQFILSYVQALLKTGAYVPDRPGAPRAVKGLYPTFQRVMKGRSELSLLVREGGESREVLVDGYFDEPVLVSRIMVPGTAELYLPKFLEMLDRWTLIQFTLKAAMTADEFQTFLEVMSAPPGAQERERITRALIEGGVVHCSTVFRPDLVGRERAMPWRVEVALSRLQRDVGVIPLHRTLTPDQAAAAKEQILRETLRPIRTPDLLLEVLVNADLISAAVQEASHLDLEAYLVELFGPPLLRLIAADGLMEFDRLKDAASSIPPIPPGQRAVRRQRLSAVLNRIACVLAPIGHRDDLTLIHHLFDRRIVEFDFLPPALKERVEVERMTDDFLADPAQALQALRAGTADAYAQGVTRLVRIAPEVIRRSQYQALLDMIAFLDAPHPEARAPEDRAYVAHLARQQLVNADHAGLLVASLRAIHAAPADAVEVLALFGRAAAGPLVSLATESTAELRDAAASALVRIGEPALTALLDGLRAGRGDRHQATVLIAIIRAIGVRRDDVLRAMELDAAHPYPEVRAEALTTLARLQQAAVERHLLKALKDADLAVRGVVVAELARLRCVKRPVIACYVRFLEGAGREEGPALEGLQVTVCQAIRSVAPALSAEAKAHLTSALRTVVGHRTWWGLGRLLHQSGSWTDRVKQEARLTLNGLVENGETYPKAA